MRRIKARKRVEYPKFNEGFNLLVGYAGQTDGVGSFNINDRFYGGVGPDNMLRQPNVDGLRILARWNQIEPTQGNYVWERIDSAIAVMAAEGRVTGVTLLAASYQETNTFLPSYIINDHATYGGTEGHGGEVPPTTGNNGWKVRWWNPNVMARFRALMDAMGAHFKDNPAFAYFHLDEFSTNISTASVKLASTETGGPDLASAGATVIQMTQREWGLYAHNAFAPKTVFMQQNYLSGDGDGSKVLANIQWAYEQGMNFSAELGLPTPYDKKYPMQPGGTITYPVVSNNLNFAKSLGFPKWNLTTDGIGSSWSAYTEWETANMMRYAAYLLEDVPESYYGIIIENGVNGFFNLEREKVQWRNIGSLFKSRFMRGTPERSRAPIPLPGQVQTVIGQGESLIVADGQTLEIPYPITFNGNGYISFGVDAAIVELT